MRFVFALVALLIASTPAAAQNLCGATAPSNPQLNTPFTIQFGWDGKDTAGDPVDPATVQVKYVKDGAVQPLVALPAPVGTPDAAGCKWFVLTSQFASKGPHTASLALVTPDGESTPVPFAFGVVGRAPSSVVKPQAKQ